MAKSTFSSLQWGKVDLQSCPHISVPPPGPRSCDYHRRCARYFKGLSTQVKLFPVAFESGAGACWWTWMETVTSTFPRAFT